LVDNLVIFGAPVGAIAWNLITCYYGIPSSSSHARIGVLLGATLMVAVSWICLRQTPRRVDKWFTRTQLVSSALYSLGHGSNDAQKTMGIIWLPLISPGGTTKDHLPM
jgi:PiT family inorganic phosphate transporter